MAKFEAHITIPREYGEQVQSLLISGWSYSAIDGDPIMGKKAYCYLTSYAPQADTLWQSMRKACTILTNHDIPTLREKIERIIYDTKTNVNEIIFGLALSD